MQKIYCLMMLMLGLCAARAQEPVEEDPAAKRRVKILNSEFLSFQKVGEEGIQKLIGDVQLQQDSTFFFCDSAYFYEVANRLEAFSRVRVEMPDSVVMICDRLDYDANERIAEAFEHVELTDQKSILYTDQLTFYRTENYGMYPNQGRLVDEDNVLTSITGYYYPGEKMAYFKREVRLVSPDYTLETDTLGYNTETGVATFLAPTLIINDEGTIFTSNGNYDTQARKVNLFDRSTVKDSTYSLAADTLYYNDSLSLGIAIGNVLIRQEDSTLEIRGQYGEFRRDRDESMITQNPVAIQFFDDDTLYVFADTLFSYVDTTFAGEKSVLTGDRNMPLARSDTALADADTLFAGADTLFADADTTLAGRDTTYSANADTALAEVDTLVVRADTTLAAAGADTITQRIFRAYHNVRFFMNDMQGRADSMVYFYNDSLMYFFERPVLWSDRNQLTGDTILVQMRNGAADSMWVGRDGFLVSEEDTIGFNQIKGKEMRAKFRDNELVRLHVIGNSESIYFSKDEGGSYQGMNKSLSQEMLIFLQDNEAKKIVFIADPTGEYFPLHEVLFKENQLEDMPWRISERPDKPEIEFEGPPPTPATEAEAPALPLASPAQDILPIDAVERQ